MKGYWLDLRIVPTDEFKSKNPKLLKASSPCEPDPEFILFVELKGEDITNIPYKWAFCFRELRHAHRADDKLRQAWNKKFSNSAIPKKEAGEFMYALEEILGPDT